MDRIVIIDGNSLINRAYYAMQRPMITKEGIYTQGIYGFLNMLNKILEDYTPKYITVAFDRKAPTFRHVAYDQYKAGRKKMPPELAMQMPLLKDVLHAMNIETLEMEGFEADDIIGTVARLGEEGGLEPLIITGDKDALQLCSDITKVIITKKGISEFDVFDKDAMMERYQLTPSQFIDLKGLMGDQSDNIPGIPGVGEKTGIKLLTQFGSVENLVAGYEQIEAAKLRQKVEDNLQLAMLSKKLATINVFTPIEVDLEKLKLEEYNTEELISIYEKLEFNSFLKKMNFSKPKESLSFDDIEYKVTILDDQVSALDLTKDQQCLIKVFTDNNHRGKPQIIGLGLAQGDRLYFYNNCSDDGLKKLVEKLQELGVNYVGHNLKEAFYSLMHYGLRSVKAEFDTQIGAYLLQPTKSSYEFEEILAEQAFINISKEKDVLEKGGQISMLDDGSSHFVDYLKEYFNGLLHLKEILGQKLAEEKLENVFVNYELPLIEVLTAMEFNGIDVDVDILDNLGASFKEEIQTLEEQIYTLAGENFNINSPQQLGIILFEKMGLPAAKKTKKGYSTSADILEKLKDKNPIIELILRYRTVSKLNSTYVEGLKPLLNENKVHAHFQQTVTATGRISCTEPNLQNIPVREPLGRELRKAYVAGEPDYVLIGADYSQIELRVLAHLSEDPELIDAFLHGEDIHRITASKVLGIPFDQVTKEERSRAKAVNFGVIYGMSSFGLSEELHITRKEAEEYITGYYAKYKKVKEFMDQQIQSAKEKGYTITISGRKRYVNEINSSNYMVRQLGERLAMNSPIQGTAADIIKLAMINVYRRLVKSGLDAKLILQVHDELIIKTHKKDQEKVKDLLVEEMTKAVDMKVPMICEPEVGYSWFQLK